jgi:hypothetical protein
VVIVDQDFMAMAVIIVMVDEEVAIKEVEIHHKFDHVTILDHAVEMEVHQGPSNHHHHVINSQLVHQ